MKVAELIRHLTQYPFNTEVVVFNRNASVGDLDFVDACDEDEGIYQVERLDESEGHETVGLVIDGPAADL